MITDRKPRQRPRNPCFSSGPCAKRPGWTPAVLRDAALGRSHRSTFGVARIRAAIDLTREILQIPADHRIAIVPGSDTGAVEMAMWSLLGPRGVEVLAWEAFGKDWVTDVVSQLKLPDVRSHVAPYGELPDLGKVDFDRDVVFTWNGTTAGVRLPSADVIPADRGGLTICDATSAVFAMALDWRKLDVVTYSWQKAMGGEAAHGVLIMSPRAIARLESFVPDRPIPKLFRMTQDGKVLNGFFEGSTINTPSMLCIEDYLDTLRWAKSIGGASALRARSDASLDVLERWAAGIDWLDFLAVDKATRSNTGVCFTVADPALRGRDEGAAFVKELVGRLEHEGVGFDFGAYRDAPPGLRIWCGPTVEASDVAILTQWLDWACGEICATLKAVA